MRCNSYWDTGPSLIQAKHDCNSSKIIHKSSICFITLNILCEQLLLFYFRSYHRALGTCVYVPFFAGLRTSTHLSSFCILLLSLRRRRSLSCIDLRYIFIEYVCLLQDACFKSKKEKYNGWWCIQDASYYLLMLAALHPKTGVYESRTEIETYKKKNK